MTTLSQFPKPEADQYAGKRKLFLVPIFTLSPDTPDDGQQLLERYWSEVRDHVSNLERSLTAAAHVYHEMVSEEGDEGMRLIEFLNIKGYPFIQAMCQSAARLEATEDLALVHENSDWQRCLSIGLMSEKVMSTALEGYRETTRKRFEHIVSRIDETLQEGEAGVLFVREDHGIQFPSNLQVFYVAPPALDALKRWLGDQSRAAQSGQPPQDSEAPATGDTEQADQSGEDEDAEADQETENKASE